MIKSLSYLTFHPLGEQVLVIELGNQITPETSRRVQSLSWFIEEMSIRGIQQVIPTMCSIAILYDPRVISYEKLINKINQLDKSITDVENKKGKVIHIPVVYGEEYGPDIEEVAVRTGFNSVEDVIQVHSSKPYLIYMLGFIGSYPYCGDIDRRLSLPRRTSPRIKCPKGTIAIANQQTIIYPMESPGGWHIIGRTPFQTFDPLMDPPTIFRTGDYIKFVPITSKEAEDWNEDRQSEWREKWNF